MKAIVCAKYGSPDVLRLQEVEKPVPADNEVLIKIMATAVNSADCRLRKADPFAVRFFFGLTRPKFRILGGVFSGEIEAVGKEVSSYKPGDKVFGSSALKYGFGAYAEYKALPESGIFKLKPESISHTEATVIPFGGMTALHFIKRTNIKPGQKVLIIGAAGSVGSTAIQLAKYYGAVVTGVCSSSNVNLVKAIGADNVIDYSNEDYVNSGKKYDVVFDTVNKLKLSEGLKLTQKNGKLVLSSADGSTMLKAPFLSLITSRKIIFGVIKESNESLMFLKALVEQGKLKPVIDRTYALEKIAQAHAYADKGHKSGNVAIIVSDNVG